MSRVEVLADEELPDPALAAVLRRVADRLDPPAPVQPVPADPPAPVTPQ